MCELTDVKLEASVAHGRRRKLWEIESTYHCSITGTCFSLDELQKIGQKAGAPAPAGVADHAVHAHYVRCAARPGRIAKLMHKALDRKYRVAVERVRHLASPAEFRRFWVGALESGYVAGPYWALLTRATAGQDFMAQMFGDVHMLSHLQAGTQRSDVIRLRELERKNRDLTNTIAKEKAVTRRRIAIHEREKQHHRKREFAVEDIKQRLANAEARLKAGEGGSDRVAPEARIRTLEQMVIVRGEDAKQAKEMLAERTAELAAARVEIDALRQLTRALEIECESMAAVLENDRSHPSGSLDLTGRCILYVGGRTGLVAHFRALVEQANGRFIHHDGGLEENEGRLSRLLSQGDIVLCPIDCVSHGACIRAKRFCKQNAKIFIPLRSAGLSSFVGGLRNIAAQAVADGAIRDSAMQ